MFLIMQNKFIIYMPASTHNMKPIRCVFYFVLTFHYCHSVIALSLLCYYCLNVSCYYVGCFFVCLLVIYVVLMLLSYVRSLWFSVWSTSLSYYVWCFLCSYFLYFVPIILFCILLFMMLCICICFIIWENNSRTYWQHITNHNRQP